MLYIVKKDRSTKQKNEEHPEDPFIPEFFRPYPPTVSHEIEVSDLVNGLFSLNTYQDDHHQPFETLNEANQITAGKASDSRNDVRIISTVI